MSEHVAECDNCGKRTRDEDKIGEKHTSILCGKGRPGTFREL